MRLSEAEIKNINQAVCRIFDADSKVRLFGSRINDTCKGGDIDLLIETSTNEFTIKQKIEFITDLQMSIGVQKIDVVVSSNVHLDNREIVKQAMEHGIIL